MVGIYKFINNEDKVYIGYSKNIERRIKNHLKVYDIKDWVIVEECSEKELRRREKFWIKYYDSYENGLNNNMGGAGVLTHSTTSKRKISESQKNKSKPHSDKWNKNIGLSLLGKKQSATTISKRRISNSKPIIQYDLNGNFIKEWVNAKVATKELNLNYPSINQCCLGNHKTSGKFKWGYK